MTKKISGCVLVMFFVGLFLACSKGPPPKEEPLYLVTLDNDDWKQVTEGKPFPWDDVDGFFPNKEHPYGFDRYPVSEQIGIDYVSIDGIANRIIDTLLAQANDSTYTYSVTDTWSPILNHKRGMKNTDSIVYISVLKGDSGKVNLKINQDFGSSLKLYNYYICTPDSPYDTIAIIDNSQREIPYTIYSNEKKIALCKESEVGPQKVQELEISSYDWKLNGFYVYILGDSTDKSNERHQLLNSTNFWDLFDSVYAQAVVKHDSSHLFGEFKFIDRGYVLTKVNGSYPNYCDRSSDINNAEKEIRSNIINGGLRRNIIQVGYPTKRFWPLRKDENNNIQICGRPTLNPSSGFDLKLEMLPDSNCSEKIEAYVNRDEDKGVWRLKYNDGRQEYATGSNVNTTCMVFVAEVEDDNYVGEVRASAKESTAAVTIPYYDISPYSPSLIIASIIIQPWLGSSTVKTALHELGHSMGLLDILKIPPSYMESNSEENNLMVQGSSIKSLKLRRRGVLATTDSLVVIEGVGSVIGLEFQWDCLHNKSDSCVNPLGIFY